MSFVERRSLGEWAVLGLLAEASAHPFALARLLDGAEPLGRIVTVRRPLVYRAVDRLSRDGLVERQRTEPGSSGPDRTVYRITPPGEQHLAAWLSEPVVHIRDLRLGFLLKVALLRRSGLPTAGLIERQWDALSEALDALAALPPEPDEADLWRHHNAAAATAFLRDLADRA